MENIFNKKVNLLLLLLSISIFIGCSPEDDFPELQNPLALKTELLEGTWQTVKVVQYDKEAIDNGFPEDIQMRNITELFPFSEYQITFTLAANGLPGTFSIDPGNAPDFLTLNEGTWELDDFVFATTISLTNVSDVNASRFRIKLLEESRILLQVVRNDAVDNTEYSFYEYEFQKVN